MSSASGDITALFRRVHEGSAEEKREAKNRIIELLYADLKQRAHRKCGNERPDHSLGATDVTHEALLRMLKKDRSGDDELDKAANEHQLIRACVRAVRQALVDHARALPPGARRGGEYDDLVEDILRRSRDEGLPQIDVLSLHEAIKALGAEFPREAEVLEL